jgi:nitrogen fixation protein NifQ
MAQPALKTLNRFERLMAAAAGGETGRHLAHLLAHLALAPRLGLGCLPLNLGLTGEAFEALFERLFEGAQEALSLPTSAAHLLETRSTMREELIELRDDERVELVELLEAYRHPAAPAELSLIIASGCLGGDHLWRDLGLPDRAALSELMQKAYPQLKARNDRDMKWKRFFYKQLCERGGGYVCRAPSCDQCSAYSDCFGPEE